MKKEVVTLTIILGCSATVALYIHYRRVSAISQVTTMSRSEASTNQLHATAVQPSSNALSPQQPGPAPPPPPPPPAVPTSTFPRAQTVRQSFPEPPRSLIGMTREDLKQLETYLPKGAEIYTHPVGVSEMAAAIISADLDGDGKVETIVVYRERSPTPEEGSIPLTLSVLGDAPRGLKMLASKGINGGVLSSMKIDGAVTYLAAHDLTGDGLPEIIVAPATGASAGGLLQVLSFDGSTLREFFHIGGHFFRIRSRGLHKPSVIEARWKDDDEVRIYQWNGQGFEEAAKRTKRRR